MIKSQHSFPEVPSIVKMEHQLHYQKPFHHNWLYPFDARISIFHKSVYLWTKQGLHFEIFHTARQNLPAQLRQIRPLIHLAIKGPQLHLYRLPGSFFFTLKINASNSFVFFTPTSNYAPELTQNAFTPEVPQSMHLTSLPFWFFPLRLHIPFVVTICGGLLTYKSVLLPTQLHNRH